MGGFITSTWFFVTGICIGVGGTVEFYKIPGVLVASINTPYKNTTTSTKDNINTILNNPNSNAQTLRNISGVPTVCKLDRIRSEGFNTRKPGKT